MLHETSRDSAADDAYPDKISDAEVRRRRGQRIAREMSRYYKGWQGRMHAALQNSPVHARRISAR